MGQPGSGGSRTACQGDADHGFPESHAISFAILAYGSAWLKVHRPSEFFASLLNNQPMGFYSSATLVKDSRRHGVKTRPVCVQRSEWRRTIEAPDDAVRLGLCVVNGLNRTKAGGLLAARRTQPFRSMPDFLARAALDRDELRTLASLGALNAFGGHRRDALWQVEKPLASEPDLFDQTARLDVDSPLASMDACERLQADYDGQTLTTSALAGFAGDTVKVAGRHPALSLPQA